MTKRMLVTLAAMLIAACGEDVNPNPSPPRDRTASSTSGLSASFTQECARCHGERGEGTERYPSIPGGKDKSAFIALVRAGRGDMPAFTSSAISDDDLKADYLWLTTER